MSLHRPTVACLAASRMTSSDRRRPSAAPVNDARKMRASTLAVARGTRDQGLTLVPV